MQSPRCRWAGQVPCQSKNHSQRCGPQLIIKIDLEKRSVTFCGCNMHRYSNDMTHIYNIYTHTLHYPTLRYATLHYTTLHYTTLLYTTLLYTILHRTLHYTTPTTLYTLHFFTTLKSYLQPVHPFQETQHTTPATFESMSGFPLPPVIHNNQTLLKVS